MNIQKKTTEISLFDKSIVYKKNYIENDQNYGI